MQNLPNANVSNSRNSPRVLAVGCACLALTATATATYVKSGKKIDLSRHKIPRPVIDAFSGAVGEFGQILLLYPVETIKVRCQTEGMSARQVLAVLVKQATQPGGAGAVARQLYSGIGASALFSMVVGAVHWLSFCTAKRAALDMLPDAPSTSRATPPHSSSSASSSPALPLLAPSRAQEASAHDPSSSSQHHHHIHISSSHHPHDEALDTDDPVSSPAAASSSTASPQTSAPPRQAERQPHHGAAAGTSSQAASGATSGSPGSAGSGIWAAQEAEDSKHQLSKRMTANIIAATCGALATALVESPVELFRHQAQAGLISGNLIREMSSSVKRDGLGVLWYGFLPFLLEAFPYDVSELATYSQLRELHTDAVRPSSRFHGLVSRLPTHVWDAGMGACAGVAAVMVSMPLDVIKTYVQTHTVGHIATSPAAQVALFFRTGRTMVRQRGLQALFVGMVPRLLQQVPSSTICWYSVEACQKALEPYAAGGPGPSSGH